MSADQSLLNLQSSFNHLKSSITRICCESSMQHKVVCCTVVHPGESGGCQNKSPHTKCLCGFLIVIFTAIILNICSFSTTLNVAHKMQFILEYWLHIILYIGLWHFYAIYTHILMLQYQHFKNAQPSVLNCVFSPPFFYSVSSFVFWSSLVLVFFFLPNLDPVIDIKLG